MTDRTSEHLAESLIERYRQRQLDAVELLALDDHLTACAICRQQMRVSLSLSGSPARLQTDLANHFSEEIDHLPELRLTGYLLNRLDPVDRELAESHLDFCEDCQSELGKLQQTGLPANAVAGASVAPAAAPRKWDERLLPSWLRELWNGNWASLPLTLRVAGAMALLALLAWGIWRWRAPSDGQQQIVEGPLPTATAENRLPETIPQSETLFAINDGGARITSDANGNLTGIESLSPAQQQAVKTALSSDSSGGSATGLAGILPAMTDLKVSASGLMGAPDGDTALEWAAAQTTMRMPFAEVVLEDRPTLRWQPLAGADSYVVTIHDPAANYREVSSSSKLNATRWTPPRPLPRGHLYIWQVTAVVKNADGSEREITAPAPKAPEAKFRVLARAQFDEVMQARQMYPDRHLTLGLLYVRFGLLKDAEIELQKLAAANPESQIAPKLLRDLRAKRQAMNTAK